MKYSSEKKHYSPPRWYPFEQNLIFLSKLIRRITVLPWRHNTFNWEECQFLSLLMRSFVLHTGWIFLFKLIFLHKRLTLFVWRIMFPSILADKVFVLFWGLNILLRRIFSLYWVLLSYWNDWFSSKTINYAGKNLILFGFII